MKHGEWFSAKPEARPQFPNAIILQSIHHFGSLVRRPARSLVRRAAMPTRLSSAISKGLLRSTNCARVFYCPSCATWRRELTTRTNTTSTDQVLPSHRPNRPLNPIPTNSTRPIITSSTISADRTVPSRFKKLYDALSGVKDASIEQVSLSRLQLALRGLESETPLIRVAG